VTEQKHSVHIATTNWYYFYRMSKKIKRNSAQWHTRHSVLSWDQLI